MNITSSPFRKGQRVTMLFHYVGLTSEEQYNVLSAHRDGSITLDTDEDTSKCFRFDTRNGECLNDNTWGGAWRTLKLSLPHTAIPSRSIVNLEPYDPAPSPDDEV